MPLINTTMNEDGHLAAIAQELVKDSGLGDKPLTDLLKDNELDTRVVLAELKNIMQTGESDSIKLRAIEMALKLNKVIDSKSDSTAPVFNIIIRDSANGGGFNPILVPRPTAVDLPII